MSWTSAPGTEQVGLDDIRGAAVRIAGIARRTPVMRSGSFDRECDVETVFKCENLQRGGAFKIRGASNFILSIPKNDLSRGVVAFSSGNHAQAVAIAARRVGAKATLVMPLDAPVSLRPPVDHRWPGHGRARISRGGRPSGRARRLHRRRRSHCRLLDRRESGPPGHSHLRRRAGAC